MYDVLIVGAGPAGATLARLVGRRFRTLLVERRAPTSGPPGAGQAKCCGGLLAPDAQRALAALGLGVPRDVLVGPQLFAVRAIDVASGRERHYPRYYLNVDRGRLDAWLGSLVPPDVTVRRGCRVTVLRREEDAVAVELESPGGRVVERARLVVGADGAASRVRRQAFPGGPEPRSYVAIQEWFEARRPDPCYTALFDPRLTDFYGWAIPKADRLVVGAALRPGANAPRLFEALLRELRRAGLRFGRSLGREGTLLYRPLQRGHVETGAGRVALVGEAAGLVSPSSAEGVSYALRSASALASSLTEAGVEGWAAAYGARTRALRREIATKRLKALVLYTPALRRAVMATAVGATAVGDPPEPFGEPAVTFTSP